MDRPDTPMRTMQLREAKAKFSALVEAAEKGETTIVTKHGRPAARIVPAEDKKGGIPQKPNLVDYLMSMPADIPLKRNRSRPRSVKLLRVPHGHRCGVHARARPAGARR
jgi:prevent-host-death family protein